MKEISFCAPYLFNRDAKKVPEQTLPVSFCHLHAKILACKIHSMQEIACCAPFYPQGVPGTYS